jgi:hypothetical protein
MPRPLREQRATIRMRPAPRQVGGAARSRTVPRSGRPETTSIPARRCPCVSLAAPEDALFRATLTKYFPSGPDPETLAAV